MEYYCTTCGNSLTVNHPSQEVYSYCENCNLVKEFKPCISSFRVVSIDENSILASDFKGVLDENDYIVTFGDEEINFINLDKIDNRFGFFENLCKTK